MNNKKISLGSAGAGLLAAFVASICCITPVFSFLAGISGIAATFSWMEPFRPYLIILTVGILGFAWYQKLKPGRSEEIECVCEEDEKPSFWQSRKFLVIVTVFAILMLVFPEYSYIFYPKSDHADIATLEKSTPGSAALETTASETALAYNTIDLTVKGMTCSGCEAHVNNAVSELEGVVEVRASYEKEDAVIKYDPGKVDQDQIVEAIHKTGYSVIKTAEKN